MTPILTYNSFGTPTSLGTPQNLRAQVVGEHRTVFGKDGKEAVSNVHAILARPYNVNMDAIYQLPSSFAPRTPPVINIISEPDENGEHHQTIYFGKGTVSAQ
jgi:hypothetical protein